MIESEKETNDLNSLIGLQSERIDNQCKIIKDTDSTIETYKVEVYNLKRRNDNHELEHFETNQARLMHYKDSRLFQKVSSFLFFVVVCLIVKILMS